MIRMMNGPDDFCGPVNLGNPEEFTIRELAELVIELTGSKIEAGHRAAAGRRPDAAPAGHHAGQAAARLGADRAAARRVQPHRVHSFVANGHDFSVLAPDH